MHTDNVFTHHWSKLFVVLALLTFLIPPRIALGQAPQGPTNPFHSEFHVPNPPSQFDEIA